jgi:hypothetical protein
MPKFESGLLEVVFYVGTACIVLFLLLLAYRLGRWVSDLAASKMMAQKEDDLFTAQKSFKNLYEQELNNLRAQNGELQTKIQNLEARVEDYRKKAAGFGGLFGSGGKRADAMYALLLENEALEEALYAQNEKLKQERADALKEQMRSTGYRRVLMSQILNDERIKSYVAEILADEKRLPGTGGNSHAPALPDETHRSPGT